MKNNHENISTFPFLEGLDAKIAKGFLFELQKIGTQLRDPELISEYNSALTVLGLDDQCLEGDSDILEKTLRGRNDEYLLAALLICDPSSFSSSLGSRNYVQLKTMVVFSTIVIKANYPDDDQAYINAIEEGCRSTRLLANESEKSLNILPRLGDDIEENLRLIGQITSDELKAINVNENRLSDICNLIKKYVEGLAPIKRNRQNFTNHVGIMPIAPSFQLEGENVNFLQDKFKSIGGRVHAAEHSGDQQSQALIVDNLEVDHEDPVEEIPAIQHANNIGFSNAVSKRHLMTTCSPHRLNTHQVKNIYGNCLGQLKIPQVRPDYVYLFIALSIVFGRTPNYLSNLPSSKRIIGANDFWYIKGKVVYLAFRPDIPHRNLPQKTKGQNSAFKKKLYFKEKSDHLLLPVPTDLQKLLISFLEAINLEISDENSAFKNITKDIEQTLRPSVLSTYIPYLYKMKGVDKHTRSLLVGESPYQNSALFYTMVYAENIYATYKAAMDDLSIEVLPCIQNKKIIGSVLIPKKKYLKQLFSEQYEQLKKSKPQTVKEWIRHHNRLAVYTYQLLNICTSHRPTISAYDNAANFDEYGQFCFIKDKDVKNTNSGRFIPLTHTAVDQIKGYKQHLKNFKAAIRFYPGTDLLEQGIDRCLDPKDERCPFLFLIINKKQPQIIPPAPRYMGRIIHQFWPMPLNWHRHYLRSYLTGKIPSESIDAFMGHGQFGASPDTPISGFSFAKMHQVRDQLQDMCDMLEIKAYLGEVA